MVPYFTQLLTNFQQHAGRTHDNQPNTGHVHGGLDGNIISQIKKVRKESMKFQKMMGMLFHA
jgi:hypothetical protein